MSASARHLVGRRIVAVDMRSFKSGEGRGKRVCHDPVVTLDDGSVLSFVVEETDSGDCYGVSIVRTVAKAKGRSS